MLKGTRIVTLLSEKGGVGKSFLARELSASLTRCGDEFELVNLDPQYAVGRVVGDAPVVVLDTPGYIGERFDLLVATSDVIVVPVRPTAANVEPLCRVVSLVRERTDAPVLIVVDGWNRHVACDTWMSWLKSWLDAEDIDGRDVFVIPQSEAVAAAELGGKSVVDVARRGYARGLAGLVMEVVNRVRDELGLVRDDVLEGSAVACDADEVLEFARA